MSDKTEEDAGAVTERSDELIGLGYLPEELAGGPVPAPPAPPEVTFVALWVPTR